MASQGCLGLHVQISLFILYHAFRYELGYVKPRFISKLPYSPLSEPKDYLLGPKLVVVAAARG